MKSLLEALIEEGMITKEELNEAKEKQVGAKRPLQELLVEMGYLKEEDLVKVSSKLLNMPITNLKKETIDISVLGRISYETAKRYGVFPVRKEGAVLVLAMSNPMDVIALDDIRAITNMNIKSVLATKSDITASIEKYYNSDEMIYDLLKNMAEETRIEIVKQEAGDREQVDTAAIVSGVSPVVRLINRLLGDAIKSRASDIHIEPCENCIKVRYRVDGDLREVMDVPDRLKHTVAARVKVMASMDLLENRKPQEGRIKITAYNRKIELAISTVPTHFGEKIMIKIFDPEEAKIDIEGLGLERDDLEAFEAALQSSQGIILVTGPARCGKTTTLYSALDFVKDRSKNIMTVEDSIEYFLEGVTQVEVNPAKNLTFPAGLRGVLKQEPDVILLGEMRDLEIVEMAFKASLTGHLIFSTMHTGTAVSTVTRLRDIGFEPYLASSAIVLILTQRLVKVICPSCEREEYAPDKALLSRFKEYIEKEGIKKFRKGKGCRQCNFTGYYGQTGIFELLKFSKNVKELVAKSAHENDIFKEAKKDGMRTLAEAGIEKVAKGITTIEEVARVSDMTEEEKGSALQVKGREKPKILVVDDEENILKVLDSRLRSAGYDVITAKDGKKAIECAVKEKPDLIIMDIMLPEMDGFEATKVLKSSLETAVIPVMMLTAKRDEESELKSVDIGADDYVVKPFDGVRLLARIKMLLRRRYR